MTVLTFERSPFPAGTFLPVLSVSPVALRTGGTTAAQGGTAQWQTGKTLSFHPSPPISPGIYSWLSPTPSPGLSHGLSLVLSLDLSLGLSPGLSELDQPLEFLLVKRVQTGTVEGGRVEFVADVTVVPQVAGHTAGGGAAPWPSDRPPSLRQED